MTMLCQVYTHPVLVPNEVEHFNVGVETFSLEAPDTRNRLPSIPGDANMTEVREGGCVLHARPTPYGLEKGLILPAVCVPRSAQSPALVCLEIKPSC